MKIVNGIMSETELEANRVAKDEVRFNSSLNFIRATNGIRPGEFSVLVGQQGNGKSSLCRTISMVCALNGVNCYHLLSEEISSVYKSSISQAFLKATNGKSADKYLSKLFFESMLDWTEKEMNVDFLLGHLEKVINDILPEMIILDNFTTSFLGALPINIQGAMIQKFRKMASSYDIAIIGVFHTAKGTDIYKKLLSGEDVRGNASSTNGGSYNYILSTYFRGEKPRALMAIDKARYHPEANKTYWELIYDKELQIYTGDKKITYQEAELMREESQPKKATFKKESKDWRS